jgi:hypothetical protein
LVIVQIACPPRPTVIWLPFCVPPSHTHALAV